MPIDPGVISAVISGVVSLVTGYMTYRVGMQSAQQNKPDDETLQKGEQTINIVRTGVSQYGTPDEKADLASFERNPQRYQYNLAQVLTDIATRTPVFMQELESLTKQLDIQTGGVQGNVNVSGQGKVIGPTTGVNTGTMSGTYTFSDRQDGE